MIATTQTPSQALIIPSDPNLLVTPGALVIDLNNQILYATDINANVFVIGQKVSQITIGNSSSNVFINSSALLINGNPFNQGFTGSRGFTGSQGVGYTGSQGVIGYTGSQGVGYTGSLGYTGSQGIIGYTGSQGMAGGYTGSQGDVGADGYTGSQGDVGYTGSIGFQGNQGNPGYTGSPGMPGLVGADTQVYFNDGGNVNASPSFTFNKSTNTLSSNIMSANIGVFNTLSVTNVSANVSNTHLAVFDSIILNITVAPDPLVNGQIWFDGSRIRMVIEGVINDFSMIPQT